MTRCGTSKSTLVQCFSSVSSGIIILFDVLIEQATLLAFLVVVYIVKLTPYKKSAMEDVPWRPPIRACSAPVTAAVVSTTCNAAWPIFSRMLRHHSGSIRCLPMMWLLHNYIKYAFLRGPDPLSDLPTDVLPLLQECPKPPFWVMDYRCCWRYIICVTNV